MKKSNRSKTKLGFTVLLLGLVPLSAMAKDLEPAKVDGEYRAERDPTEPTLTLELKNYAVTGKITSLNPDQPSQPPSVTNLRGEYFVKDDIITMTFDRVRCKVKYKDNLEFYSGSQNGPGLEILPAAGKRPALCKNSFKKMTSVK